MKIYLLSFATKSFELSQDRLCNSAQKYNIKHYFKYRLNDLRQTDFYRDNYSVLKGKKGAGYWLWKPYYIYQALTKLKENDYLIYADAGIEFVHNPRLIISSFPRESILLFYDGGMHTNEQYVKEDCYILMNCNSRAYRDSPQVQASFQIYKNNKQSRQFVREWLSLCQNPNILTDSPNIWGEESPNFVAHRHDQSVLSLLAVKHKIMLHRDPSQWGNHKKTLKYRVKGEFLLQDKYSVSDKKSNYPTILNHHRNLSKTNFIAKVIDYVSKLNQ